MRASDAGLVLTATDLSHFLGCRHRTGLQMAVAFGTLQAPHFEDPLLQILFQRGDEHEHQYVEALRRQGLRIVELHRVERERLIAETVAAMRAGADVIVQGGLGNQSWFGKPDILERVPVPSELGDWSYEVVDTKLARETRAGTILQLSLYTDLLAAVQGREPTFFHVVTPDPVKPRISYRVDDYSAYYRLVRKQLEATTARKPEDVMAENYPEPVDDCAICNWSSTCSERRHRDDHLSLVAGISRVQRREFESRNVPTLTDLAGFELSFDFKPARGSREGYQRVRDQARVQLESRGKSPPVHELLPLIAGKGLGYLPEPSPGDIFLDLEGDLFAREGGREYLFGVVTLGPDGAPEYRGHWAFSDHDERRAFESFIQLVMEAWAAHPGMHVYHYAPYEPSALKRLMGRYATKSAELDRLLRGQRFVDLFAVVRQGVRVGVESYSIKQLEPLYGFLRSVDLRAASVALRTMEVALESNVPEGVPQEIRDRVEGYNRDDCLSTLHLRDWLEQRRADLEASGTVVPRPVPPEPEAPKSVDERAARVEELRRRLLDGVPEDAAERSGEQRARWILAYLLDWHRREDRVTWWEYFRLRDLPEENLLDEPDAVAQLAFVERVELIRNKRTRRPTGSVVDRYRFPPQELELRPKDSLRLQDESRFGTVVAVDREGATIDIKKGPDLAETHPTAAFRFAYFDPEPMEDAITRIAEAIAADGALTGGADQPDASARDLLLRSAPRLQSQPFDGSESSVEAAIRAVLALDRSVLAVQGPPGSGKTYCGARMVCHLVKAGKKVGVTATSHKVIQNLLTAIREAGKELGIGVVLGHRGEDDDPTDDDGIMWLGSSEAAAEALTTGAVNVLGGTAWLWARDQFDQAVDVLFVDEAGQMALANVIAVSHAAKNLVLLGDPRQLEQPKRGAHPEGCDTSALHHILGTHQTMPPDRGLFIPVTRRLAPPICAYTSEVFYERKLHPIDGLQHQRLSGAGDLDGSGIWVVEVDHDGNRNASTEEVAAIEALVQLLTAPDARWTDAERSRSNLTSSDILVVAPYNAQVSRIADRLAPTGVRVGTVDKFQGQQAPVAIYSMATSRPEDAPRGMEFLYNANRLNVATSRARCAAIVVASPHLFEPQCRSPRQMQLANALCRLREMGRVLRFPFATPGAGAGR
jgi:uncharacterized protein